LLVADTATDTSFHMDDFLDWRKEWRSMEYPWRRGAASLAFSFKQHWIPIHWIHFCA